MPIINEEAESDGREYHSPLREAQAEATHDRILEGVVRTMAKGVSQLSVPAVAREAGVSVATVYRHFPSKDSLLTELPTYFARQSGMGERWDLPATWQEFEALVLRLFAAYARFDDIARAAMVSELGRSARQAQLPARIEFSRAALANVAPRLEGEALDRVNRLALVLISSSSFRSYDSLGEAPADAADHVLWAIRTVLEAEGAEVVER
jgi:AcrR family transcriptional regulator